MELANALLALSGDRHNTVPKYDITPAEIAVLLAIHGDDAVFDIEPTGETVNRSAVDEMQRLVALYPAKNEDGNLIATTVYPGRQPILHTTIADLGLSDTLFATSARLVPAEAKDEKPKKAPAKAAPITPSNDATSLFEDEDVTQ